MQMQIEKEAQKTKWRAKQKRKQLRSINIHEGPQTNGEEQPMRTWEAQG